MQVTQEKLAWALETIANSKVVAVDCETTSLNSFKDGELFSIIVSCEADDFYFNFKDYPEEGVEALPRESIAELQKALDNVPLFFGQNFKFDMHMLAREGLFIKGKIYDLMCLERIHFNQHMRYNLKEIAKRWGDEKLDIVWEYIEANKLKSVVEHERLGKTEELVHFDRVPFSLIQPYGEQDARATLNIGLKILAAIEAEDALIDPRIPRQMQVMENEARLTHTLFNMERRGIQLDMNYCNEALDYYMNILRRAEAEFKALTGLDFVKGTSVFEEVFASEQNKWEKTEKDNWKWDADVLSKFENPSARVAVEWAEAKKQSEYFANFIFYAGADGVLHTTFNQAGTVTGRLSSRDPNTQNLSSPDKYEEQSEAAEYPVRRAFIPRPGFFFAMIDYSQMEFRLMLEYANANSLIKEIIEKDLDVHTATANVSGVTRKEAKTVNFLTAYGGGVVKLAQNLFPGKLKGSRAQLGAIYKKMFKWRFSDEEQQAWPTVTDELRLHNEPHILAAYNIQQSIFRSAPEIKDFLKSVQRAAESRGYIRNWYGRRYYFNDKRFSYKAGNHLIQGGSAEVTKIAMNRVDEYLKDKESKMLLSIHDELVVEVRYGEEHVVEEIKRIMETVFPHKKLPLLAEMEWSDKNLADKATWPPENFSGEQEAGNHISQ